MQGLKIIVIATLIFVVSLLNTGNLYAGQDMQNIFMVEATNCVSMPDLRVQTGFRLDGINGIITALHGVVGCNYIIARQPEANKVYKNLTIHQADIEHDVAILAGASLPNTGSLLPHPTGIPADDAVKVIGHPSAMPGLWEMPLTLESRELQKLYLRLQPGLMKAVLDRNSPSPMIDVLTLNGDLQPGHSGAPIIDAEGKVLGIGSGGLGDGTLGIGWAIPIHAINPRAVSTNDPDMQKLAGKEPTLVFSHEDPYQPAVEPVVRSSGTGCINQTFSFDLDRGDSSPSHPNGDLFHNARTSIERYLVPNPWSNSTMALIGNRDFERVTFAALQSANYSRSGFSSSKDSSNRLPPGTVLAVKTNEGRYAKLRINSSSGDAVHFKWVTYALPSEGPSPIPPALEPCGPEGRLLCNAGTLAHDRIEGFRVLQKNPNELLIEVRARYNTQHSKSWMGAYLLDKDGNNLSGGFYPTPADMGGRTQMRVISKGGQSRYLFIWLYESNKSEAFICRRFDYRSY